jgi:predicted aspartyl protease
MTALAAMMRPTKKFPVGITQMTVRISNLAKRSVGFEQKLIVDTGAMYTIVPGVLLRRIGVEPDRVRTFELADGRRIEREMGGVVYEFEGESGPAPVIFGKRGDAPLLGVVTLEALGFDLDPLRHSIRPMRRLLL